MLKSIATAIRLALIASVTLAVCGCSKTATTRKDQKAEFKDLFGIAPPAAVVDIRYHEKSSTFGGWSRWMSFTYDAATYDAVLKKGGYKLSRTSMGGFAESGAPAWWPKVAPPQAMLYSRGPNETPVNEGYQFLEFMWHDPSSGLVYFSKSYWD